MRVTGNWVWRRLGWSPCRFDRASLSRPRPLLEPSLSTGKATPSKPLSMDADPACAKKHSAPGAERDAGPRQRQHHGKHPGVRLEGRSRRQDLPVPKTPVTLDQNGCQYKPHVMGIMVGQTYRILNSDGVLHNIHTLPKVNPSFNKGMPATLKEATTVFDKPEDVFHIKCDVHPWMSAYIGRLHASVLLGNGHRREVHDLRPRPRDLRDHRLAREAGDQDGFRHRGRQRHKTQDFKFASAAK